MTPEQGPDDADPITGEFVGVEELRRLLEQAAQQPPGAPMPPPAPGPPPPRFPEPATPGAPPPPLPHPEPRFVEPSYGPQPDSTIDPALENGFTSLEPWRQRLRAATEGKWSGATLLQATGPLRHSQGPDVAFLDEAPLQLTLAHLPIRSLNPVPSPTPLLSRLRMLHERMLPDAVRYPVSADWYELGGMPAVLDRLAQSPGGPAAGFSLAAELGPDLGLVAVGSAPPSREDALVRVAIPLAATGRATPNGLTWCTPPLWSRTEELTLTTDVLQATARLVPLPQGWGLAEWTDSLFAQAPFLRDMRDLGTREVRVPGVEIARLQRFDWQPSGRGRLLTSVVSGISDDVGFSFVLEVPFEAESDVLLADPDAILSMVRVEPAP